MPSHFRVQPKEHILPKDTTKYVPHDLLWHVTLSSSSSLTQPIAVIPPPTLLEHITLFTGSLHLLFSLLDLLSLISAWLPSSLSSDLCSNVLLSEVVSDHSVLDCNISFHFSYLIFFSIALVSICRNVYIVTQCKQRIIYCLSFRTRMQTLGAQGFFCLFYSPVSPAQDQCSVT